MVLKSFPIITTSFTLHATKIPQIIITTGPPEQVNERVPTLSFHVAIVTSVNACLLTSNFSLSFSLPEALSSRLPYAHTDTHTQTESQTDDDIILIIIILTTLSNRISFASTKLSNCSSITSVLVRSLLSTSLQDTGTSSYCNTLPILCN